MPERERPDEALPVDRPSFCLLAKLTQVRHHGLVELLGLRV